VTEAAGGWCCEIGSINMLAGTSELQRIQDYLLFASLFANAILFVPARFVFGCHNILR